MNKALKFLPVVAIVGFLLWAFSQTDREPRFARIGALGGGGQAGPVLNPVGIPGMPAANGGLSGAPGGSQADAAGRAKVNPNQGPTLGPPPSLEHRTNKLEPGDQEPVYDVDPEISQYASHSTVAFTRIHQILVEAGEGEAEVAKKVTDFQRVLKDMRRGDDVDPEALAQHQEEVVIEIKKVLTGDEVDTLLAQIEGELASLQAEAEPAVEEDE